MTISYSDGKAIESKILSLLQTSKSLGSGERIAQDQYRSWPVRYHLCPERSNLIRHFDWSGLDVLELGAGMGAVSRYIAERARSLTVVEGTESRFAALSERLRDLKNWTGIIANIQDASVSRQFDVVCIFGVLEYSELYITPLAGESPFASLLTKARAHLKEDGILLLAIENKLGMKYWSGAAEDHTGRLFDGVSGYPQGKSPRTFSRKELTELLSEAGLPSIREYYPFPDYKVPTSVLSLEFLESDPALAADLATNQPYENYGMPRLRCFPDALAMRNVADAGLLAEFSNSFLFAASAQGSSPTRSHFLRRQDECGELAWHYSLARKTQVQTTFLRGPGDRILVQKTPLDCGLPKDVRFDNGSMKLRWRSQPPTPTLKGNKLKEVLLRHAYFGEWNEFQSEFKDFLNWSLRHWSCESPASSLGGEALDATFINAVVDKPGTYSLFDLEWSLDQPFPCSWFVFRNVYLLQLNREFFTSVAPFRTFRHLYVSACNDLGVKEDFLGDLNREVAFQLLVTQQTVPVDVRYNIFQGLRSAFPSTAFPRTPHRSRRHKMITFLKRILGVVRFEKLIQLLGGVAG